MFNFHQWTVAKKMVLTGAVLLVMLVAICSLAVLSLSRAQRNFDNFVSDDFSRGGLARDVRAATSARAISARNLILLNGPEDVKAETIAVKAAIKGLIETSVGKVQAGSGLVNSAGLAMTDIVQEVNRVADLIREISDATQDQAKGINHISGSVAQLDQATQQNAALVEQMAGAAGALNQQAQGLVHSVAVFRLAEQGSPGPSLAMA